MAYDNLLIMANEVCTYRLSYLGKPVGTFTVTSSERGANVFLDSQLQLQGSLGRASVTQKSKLHKHRLSSYFYNEETQEANSKRQFNVTFDYHKGIVRASKSAQDYSEVPLHLPYSDPLSLLYHLRQLGPDDVHLKIPLLGKAVYVERIQETKVETSMGPHDCFVYKVSPGTNYVYISKEKSKPIVSMTVRLDGRNLEAQLIKVHHETSQASSTPQKSKSNRRRPKRNPKSASKNPA